MRYRAVFVLLVIVCTASVAHGGKKNASKKADLLAKEVMSKVIYHNTNILARAEECSLRISFETLNTVFHLPLAGTTIAQTGAEDSILVANKNMTRTIKGRAPEPFEQLTLRVRRDSVQSMLRSFRDAVASCSKKSAQVAAN